MRQLDALLGWLGLDWVTVRDGVLLTASFVLLVATLLGLFAEGG